MRANLIQSRQLRLLRARRAEVEAVRRWQRKPRDWASQQQDALFALCWGLMIGLAMMGLVWLLGAGEIYTGGR